MTDAGPFKLAGRFAPFALGYGALWLLLLLMAEAGGAQLAAAIAVTTAGGMTAFAADQVISNAGLGGK